jgi:hypothetical protein
MLLYATVADENALRILKRGASDWNDWGKQHFPRAKADLSGSDLNDADLRGTDLSGADLSGSDLRRAKLSRANLSGVDLSGADLSGANFTRANLSRANLSGADLRWVSLNGTNLDMATLSQARVGYTLFVDVDLSRVQGIESVWHDSPSSVGIETIYKSNGQIPEIFLRGAGVPEPFIVQMKALVRAMEPIQFYSCFISYSSKDQEFAERLHADLQAKGVRCWFAPHNVHGGELSVRMRAALCGSGSRGRQVGLLLPDRQDDPTLRCNATNNKL